MVHVILLLAAIEAGVLLSHLIPTVSLAGAGGYIAFAVSESGGMVGMPVLVTVLLLAHFTTREPNGASRRREAGTTIVALACFLGAGAYINEFHIKPAFEVPRPNIEELVASGTLDMDARTFYALGDKDERRAHLEKLLLAPDYSGPALPGLIRGHWAHEAGYSFPSGHSFGAVFFVAFFLGLRMHRRTHHLNWPYYLLGFWAVAVCCSRVVLRVHTPADVSAGALQGALLGLLAYLITAYVLRPPRQAPL